MINFEGQVRKCRFHNGYGNYDESTWRVCFNEEMSGCEWMCKELPSKHEYEGRYTYIP